MKPTFPNGLTDEYLASWLPYIEDPTAWNRISAWRRFMAGEMSKGRQRTNAIALGLVGLYLILRITLLVLGVPLTPLDLLIMLIVGVVIGMLLMLG